MSEPLRITVTETAEGVRIALAGELDSDTVDPARDALDAAVDSGAQEVRVDIEELSFLDSAGIWLLISSHDRCRRNGGRFVLGPPKHATVRRTFQVSGLDQIVIGAPAESDDTVLLRLYVSERPQGRRATVGALEALVERFPEGAVRLEVLDVLAEPKRAEEDRIIATPTLIRLVPGPPVRLIGEITDPDEIMRHLDLRPPG